MEDQIKIATSAGFIHEMEKEALIGGGAFRAGLRSASNFANKFLPGAGNALRDGVRRYVPALGEAGHNIINTQIGGLVKRYGTVAADAGAGAAKKPGWVRSKLLTPGHLMAGGALAATGGLMYAGSKAYQNPGDNYTASYGNAFGGGFQAQQ